MNEEELLKYNQRAWDQQVSDENEWTQPVSDEVIAEARNGIVNIVLTPQKPVPKTWLPSLKGRDVLCLASGGGQQGPVLAAAGASVTVFDNSPMQLQQDQKMSEKHSLGIKTIQGDMKDLSVFSDESFDLIVHPCSNCFVPDVIPVWKEAHRVLRNGGHLLSGFNNPVLFLFDEKSLSDGDPKVRFSIPYSDEKDLTPEELQAFQDKAEPLAFGHSLDDQIGGQIDAGFAITGFYEDRWSKEKGVAALSERIALFVATRASKI